MKNPRLLKHLWSSAKLVVDHVSFSVFDIDSYTAKFQKLNEHNTVIFLLK